MAYTYSNVSKLFAENELELLRDYNTRNGYDCTALNSNGHSYIQKFATLKTACEWLDQYIHSDQHIEYLRLKKLADSHGFTLDGLCLDYRHGAFSASSLRLVEYHIDYYAQRYSVRNQPNTRRQLRST